MIFYPDGESLLVGPIASSILHTLSIFLMLHFLYREI